MPNEQPKPDRPVPTGRSEPRAWARLEYAVALGLLVVFLVAGWRARRPLLIRGSDELIYVNLSHSLENGSYRDAYLVGTPLHSKYPPAYPAWLIPLRHLGKENLDRVILGNLLLAAGALFLFYLVARQISGSRPSLALLLLLVTNPTLLDWSGSLMAEGLFLWFSILSLGAAFWADRSGRSAIPAMTAAGLAFLTRTAGIALVAGLGVWLWHRRRRTELVVFVVGSAIVVGGWFAYTGLVPKDPVSHSYQSDVAALTTNEPGGTLESPLARVGRSAFSYVTQTLPSSLSLPTLPGTILDNLFWLAVSVGLFLPGLLLLWRSWRPAAAYLLLYGAMLTVWWEDKRLLVPALPLIGLAMLLGALHLGKRLPGAIRGPTLSLLFGLAAFGTVRGTINLVQQRGRCDRSDPIHSPGCHSPEILSLVAGAEYLRGVSAPEDVILTGDPVTVNYLTGRLTVPSRLIRTSLKDKVAERLRELKVRYVLLSAVRWSERTEVARALIGACRELRVIASFEPHTLVLAPADVGQGSDACSALRRFVEETRSIHAEPPP